MKTAPSIAVVIPVYNGEDYVREAIESALAQSHPPSEIVVLDDASSDASPQILAAYARHPQVRVHRLPDRVNAPTAWNHAIRLSSSEYFVVLGHDDILHRGFLAEVAKALVEAPDAGFVVTGYRLIDGKGSILDHRPIRRPELLGRTPFEVFFNEMVVCGRMYFRASSNVVRRADFDALGGFDERIRGAFDFDFYIRLAGTTPTLGLGAALIDYRMHSANISTARYFEEDGDCDVIFDKMGSYSMLSERQKSHLVANISLFQFQYFSRSVRSSAATWADIRRARSAIRNRLSGWARSGNGYAREVRTSPSRAQQWMAWQLGSTRPGVASLRWALRSAPQAKTFVHGLARWARTRRALLMANYRGNRSIQ